MASGTRQLLVLEHASYKSWSPWQREPLPGVRMSVHPCSIGMHRFRGPADTWYPAISRMSEMTRWKFWTCPEHSAFVEEALRPYEISEELPLDGRAPNEGLCLCCGAPTDQNQRDPVYVTAYLKGQDRRDFWAFLHRSCGRPGFLPED